MSARFRTAPVYLASEERPGTCYHKLFSAFWNRQSSIEDRAWEAPHSQRRPIHRY